jgi:trans-2-enoyl-CoA reductase
LTAIVETLKESNESTKKELEAYKAAEEQRKLAERKALITKHISADTFKGDTEAFTKKIEWINARNFNDEDLAIYLSEAFPIKIESADDKTKDLPDKYRSANKETKQYMGKPDTFISNW